MRILSTLICLIILAFAPVAGASDIVQKIVRLTTSDGVQIDAVLMHPASGMNIASPAIVMHHGGPSGHAARSIGAYRFAAERFAAQGYTTLSPVSRHSSGFYKYVLQDSTKDIAASVDFIASFGFDRIVLAGHSMGSIRITHYMMEFDHPLVKAMVHFAPTADVYDFVGKRDAVAPVITEAQAALAAGRGGLDLHPNSVDPDTSLEPPSMMATARGRLQTPEALLSWWGPGYPTANSDFFPELKVPQLLLAGTEDPPVPPGRMERLKELAVNSPRVDYIWYQDGDHYFTFHQEESSRDTLTWLADIGLGPERRVTAVLKDTELNASFTPDGQRVPYPGIAYLAEGVDQSTAPLMVYLYGLGEQIFEDPLHRLGTLMAAKGYEGLAPQLRESGYRGSLTSTIARSAEDIKDVIAAHRDGERPIVFVGYREGILWAMEAVESYEIESVAGFVALSPPPDLPDYAESVLGEERYDSVVERSEALVAANDMQTAIVEKYFRPAPAVAGSTSAFLAYPETFLEYYGPGSKAAFSEVADDLEAPLLLINGTQDSLLSEALDRTLNRLARDRSTERMQIEGSDEWFMGREGVVADAIAEWLAP